MEVIAEGYDDEPCVRDNDMELVELILDVYAAKSLVTMSVKQETNLLFCVVKEIVSAKTAFGDTVEKLGVKMAVELSKTALVLMTSAGKRIPSMNLYSDLEIEL